MGGHLRAELYRRTLTLDIENVTVVSQEGENALLQLINEGAKLSADGILARHVLEELARRGKNELRNSAGENRSPRP